MSIKSLVVFTILSLFSILHAQQKTEVLKETLKDVLEKISKLEDNPIDKNDNPFYPIKKTLTKEQWDKVNKLTYN